MEERYCQTKLTSLKNFSNYRDGKNFKYQFWRKVNYMELIKMP